MSATIRGLFASMVFAALSVVAASAFAEGGHAMESQEAHSAASEHESGHSGHGDTGAEGHGEHHVPHFSDINWATGFLGEKEGVEPSLLWRSPGTPIPLGALILNTAILFYLIGRFGGPGIKKGLVGRKQKIAGDIERAAKMRAEAEEQLAHYEEKLEQMGAEMQRIKAEMKQQAEADRAKLVTEAKERRAAIEAEARTLIQQELAQARYDATVKAVSAAVEAAREEIKSGLGSADHERLAKEFVSNLSTNMKSKGVSS